MWTQPGFDSDDDDDDEGPKSKKSKTGAGAGAGAGADGAAGDGEDRHRHGAGGEAPMVMLPEWIAKAAKKGYTREEYVSKFWKVQFWTPYTSSRQLLLLRACCRVGEARLSCMSACR